MDSSVHKKFVFLSKKIGNWYEISFNIKCIEKQAIFIIFNISSFYMLGHPIKNETFSLAH